MYKPFDRTVDLLASITSVGDMVLDVYHVFAIKKQNKVNRNVVIGAHIVVSALAVGVSMYHTVAIKKEISKIKEV